MKRFYCTICKKVRRVRILPRHISANTFAVRNQINNATKVEDRVGFCDKHEVAYEKKMMGAK